MTVEHSRTMWSEVYKETWSVAVLGTKCIAHLTTPARKKLTVNSSCARRARSDHAICAWLAVESVPRPSLRASSRNARCLRQIMGVSMPFEVSYPQHSTSHSGKRYIVPLSRRDDIANPRMQPVDTQ